MATTMENSRKTKFLGIGGGSASGKSTLAAFLLKNFQPGQIALLSVDHYYRRKDEISLEDRVKINYDSPDSLEFELLAKHLKLLSEGNSASIPRYDFALHNRSAVEEILSPCPIVIVEGILALWDLQVRSFFDYKIFVEAPAELRYTRRLARDIAERGRDAESVLQQWNATVEPMYQQFCLPCAECADLVLTVDSQGALPVASVVEQIQFMLSES